MKRIAPLSMICFAVAGAVMGQGLGTASAGPPIGPGQHFVGQVNGSHRDPVVEVACPGPVRNGGTGVVVGGQTVAVARVAQGKGYTGLFGQVYAWFDPPKGSPAPTEMTIADYRTPVAIPSTITVPCGGSGVVTFSSCPYLAPCAFGWIPYTVKVTFENIAV